MLLTSSALQSWALFIAVVPVKKSRGALFFPFRTPRRSSLFREVSNPHQARVKTCECFFRAPDEVEQWNTSF